MIFTVGALFNKGIIRQRPFDEGEVVVRHVRVKRLPFILLTDGDRNRFEMNVLHEGIGDALRTPIVSHKVVFKTIFVVTKKEALTEQTGAAQAYAVGEIGAGGGHSCHSS